eukprot:1140283-Pelagomonas_calceolata.AAC.1
MEYINSMIFGPVPVMLRPPSWPRDRCPRCVIYLYCDPLEVVASHYRRGHAWHQSLKTCGKPRVHEQRAQSRYISGSKQERAAMLLGSGMDSACVNHFVSFLTSFRSTTYTQAFPPSLEAYCELGIDLFGLEDHFHNWKAGANYEILIISAKLLDGARLLGCALYEHVFDPPVAQALFSRLCAPRNLTATQASLHLLNMVGRSDAGRLLSG